MTKSKGVFLIICLFSLTCSFGGALSSHARNEGKLGGSVEAEQDGEIIHFPVLKTDIKTEIDGDLATVEISQYFANPSQTPLHARYLFPLNKDAAVFAMTMELGDEIIEAQIKRIEQAKETFEKAKKAGKVASLLTQYRPNMFTQNIANLMPGLPIKVTIKYTQSVPKIDGQYELVIPLIVGPRYQPSGAGQAPEIIDDGHSLGKQKTTGKSKYGNWEAEKLPEYPPVPKLTIPEVIEQERVSITVRLKADMPLQQISSTTHKITVSGTDKRKTVSLQQGRVIDNRDFVLRFQLSGQKNQAGFLSVAEGDGGYFSLMIEPPTLPEEENVIRREMVFVLDTSGSMGGRPIEASKTFMQHALQNLRRGDSFRIISFNNTASEFRRNAVIATPENIAIGLDYINQLSTGGGTEIPSAISQAFSSETEKGVLRIVVFLTDGYIGNEASVLRQVADKIGDARIYAFGVGTSVNRYLLSEMARAGRGFARFIDPMENLDDVAIALAAKLGSPLLTDITVDWGSLKVEGLTPALIPDLFAGDSIRLQGKFTGTGQYTIYVKCKARGHTVTLPVQVTVPTENSNDTGVEGGRAISLTWARSRVADMMRQMTAPHLRRTTGQTDDHLKEQIVDLALQHSIMTRWTSFVAVSRKVVNASSENALVEPINLPMVDGVTEAAYGQIPPSTAVPEPGTAGAFLVLGLAGLIMMRRKKR